jgi:hypothetical protein
MKIVRGLHWIAHDAHMVIKAPKVSISSKIALLLAARLRGFKDSIVKFKPKIIIEVKEFNRKEVFEFFEEVNYTCHRIPEDESGEYFICAPRS